MEQFSYGRREGSKTRQWEKLGCDAVTTKATAHPTVNSAETGMTLKCGPGLG